jgi:hypothetical protein
LSRIEVAPKRPEKDKTKCCYGGELMSQTADDLSKQLPTAKQVMEQAALAAAEKASAAMRKQARDEEEKKALIDRLSAPSGVSDEEALNRVAKIIQRAVKNGLAEVQIIRFPDALCTDRGRAINNNLEPGWEKTLTGLPKEMYEFWNRQLRPRGYKIRFQVVDFTGGKPGDIGITLKWG